MKVLIVSFFYEPEVGAAPYRIANLAKGLKQEGAEVDVLTCLPNYPEGRIFKGYRNRFSMKENLNGIRVFRYWTYATVSKNPLKRVVAMLAFSLFLWCFAFRCRLVKSYDRIIIQTPPLLVAASAMLLFKVCYGKLTLLNVSDLWPLSAVQLGALKEGSFSYRYLSLCEKFLYKQADAVMGQSEEILMHVRKMFPEKKTFLYRNLNMHTHLAEDKKRGMPMKIVYAGLLGVAQNMYGLLRNVNFKELGVEMHLYGGGNQLGDIQKYIDSEETCIYYHGYVSKAEIETELLKYDLSIVPLATHIYGAVPSKIFDLLPKGIPILFSGTGEGAKIVEENGFGLVSSYNDYKQMEKNIHTFANMPDDEYFQYVSRCKSAAVEKFSFAKQIKDFDAFLRRVGE